MSEAFLRPGQYTTPRCRLYAKHKWRYRTGRSDMCECGMVRWRTARSIWYYKLTMRGRDYTQRPHRPYWAPVDGGDPLPGDAHLEAAS